MPGGTPRTDDERKERHKELHGDENVPEQRSKSPSGEGATKKLAWAFWVKAALVLLILYFLWLIVQRGWIV